MLNDFERIKVTSESKAITIEATQRLIGFPTLAGKDGSAIGVQWGSITGDINDQTDLQSALNAKANTTDLGDLAFADTVDYSALTNKPTLGTMAAVNDASSDNKTYGRKNGSWVEVTGGGGGGGVWGTITGTLSNQTDLQNALDAKAEYAKVTYYVNPSTGSDTNDGSSASPFATIQHAIICAPHLGSAIILLNGNATETITIAQKTIYLTINDYSITGNVTVNNGYLCLYGGTIIGNVSISNGGMVSNVMLPLAVTGRITVNDSRFSVQDTLTLTNLSQNVSIYAVGASQVSIRVASITADKGLLATYGAVMFIGTLSGTMTTETETTYGGKIFIGGASVSWGDIGGTIADQTDLQSALNAKANTADLGTMASEDDAPSDSKEYVRKNGAWSEATGGGGGGASWGAITGTLSDQTDLQTALNGKQGTLTFDSTPTASSSNPVTSDGIKTALDAKQNTLTFDSTPTSSSTNPVTSGGVYTALTAKADKASEILYFTGQTVNTATNAEMLHITDSSITANHVLLRCEFTSEAGIPSSPSWNSYNGYFTISGTCNSATTANITLGLKGN